MSNDYLTKVNFLIVDDHTFTLKLIRNVLATFGAKNVEVARDGTEALTVMKAFHADVVIVD
ncbi:MAG: response regulator [Rhodospirillales bacterium]|nr:response regulator [Rhodospirillales bacterium]